MLRDGGTQASSGGAGGQTLRLAWVQPAGLVGLSFANFFLRLITLGIYNFWGKTEVRRRIWSAIRLDGEPLSYTGTGKELFLGFLVIFAIIGLPIMLGGLVVFYFFGSQSVPLATYQVLIYLLLFYLTGVAIYSAQRFRLSRTTWRGIRGGIVGDRWSYGWTYFWTLLVPFGFAFLVSAGLIYAYTGGENPFPTTAFAPEGAAEGAAEGTAAEGTPSPVATPSAATIMNLVLFAIVPVLAASWIFPWRTTKLQHFMTGDTRFGDRAFRFDGEAGPLYVPFAVFWFGVALPIILLAAYLAWQFVGSGASDFVNPETGAPDPVMALAIFFGGFLVVLPIMYLLFLLLSAFYRARQINHFAKHTHYEGAKLNSTVTGRGLVWNAIGNFFLRLIGSILGLALVALLFGGLSAVMGTDWLASLAPPDQQPGTPPPLIFQLLLFLSIVILASSANLFGPIIQARTSRYLVQNLSIEGNVPLDAIVQGKDQGLTRGEGLAQAFDVDGF